MENASKALYIAGSILLAIIVISIFVYSYTKITEMQQAKVNAENSQEVTAFNEPFVSYQKKRMYGTDVISILNLAISNNHKYHVNPGEEYYVNITFKLNQDILNITHTYKFNETTGKYEQISVFEDIPGDTSYLKAGEEYSLENDYDKISSFLPYANNPDVETQIIEKKKSLITKYNEIYTSMANFKRYTFKCTTVEYDENGRLNLMKFQQV